MTRSWALHNAQAEEAGGPLPADRWIHTRKGRRHERARSIFGEERVQAPEWKEHLEIQLERRMVV